MTTDDALFARHRLLLYYKGDISALTLFAQHESGRVCFPSALPALSEMLDETQIALETVTLHPALLLKALNAQMQFDDDLLRIEPASCEQIDTPQGIISVYMARFFVLDPPHQLLKARQCQFKTLMELRSRPPAEMELLRRAYVRVMES